MKKQFLSKATILLLVGTIWASAAIADQGFQRSVNDIMVSQPTPSDIDYVVDRCSGLFISVLSVVPEDNPLYTPIVQKLDSTLNTAVEIRKTKGQSSEQAHENLQITVKMFASSYLEYLNDSYVRTSNYLQAPIVVSDLEACSKFVNMLQGL